MKSLAIFVILLVLLKLSNSVKFNSDKCKLILFYILRYG